MALSSGDRLGPYQIIGEVGSGGMGCVYRARDTTLDRDVAIKILPEFFASDPDRLLRFAREAKTLAALNHPNIAGIHGIEGDGGVSPEGDARPTALVMEFVEGEDLSQRIARGAIPLDEALPIARQIADALQAAHDAGIVHRDLKPANVKVRADGTVKVLDFGLAKATAGVGSPIGERTGLPAPDMVTSPALTQMGVILGTAAYMAPEQARGLPVDRRADIWAFGVILYEMITGRRAFGGDDVTTTLASVIKDDVGWDALPAETPPAVRRLLRRCLTRNLADRLHAIADARLELDEAVTAGAETASSEVAGHGRRPLVIASVVVAVLFTGALSGWVIGSRGGNVREPVRRLVVQTEPLSRSGPVYVGVAIAPDSSYLVYVAGEPHRLHMRRLDQMESVPLAGTEGASTPFISPDSESIGFVAQGQVKVIPRSGGAPSVLHTFKDTPAFYSAGASWASDGSIYLSAGLNGYATLWKIPPGGGTAQQLVPLADERGVRREDAMPQVLPGGKTLLFGALPGDVYWECRQGMIKALDLDSGRETVILKEACFVRYVETGHLVFFTGENQLSIAPFDATALQVTGPPRPLPLKVQLRERRIANFVTASDGTLVYEIGSAEPASQVVWLDRNGTETPASDQPRDVLLARLSPRGDRIAEVITGPEGVGRIWMQDIARRVLSPVSPPGPSYRHLAWMPDGRSLIALRLEEGLAGIYRISVDGSFQETLLHDPKTPFAAPWDVSPDGRFVAMLIWSVETDKDWDIQIVPVDGSGPPLSFARESTDETSPRFSPDGQWLTYSSSRSGRPEVYVKRFPEAGAPIQVSNDGGQFPFWSPDGATLFYVHEAARRLVSISVDLHGAAPVVGEPQAVVDLPSGLEPLSWMHWADVSRDGKRFLLIRSSGGASTALGVVLNWFRELEANVPVP